MEVDRSYPVVTVESLATRIAWPKAERYFFLTVVECSLEVYYVLPLDDFLRKMRTLLILNLYI
jgi:hypothetical protein